MPEVSKSFHSNEVEVSISEVIDGIYRIAGFVETYGTTFNQFLIQDENPILIHTGPIGMYRRIEEKVREVINLEKLSYVAFLHFESDEWGGMEFLKSPRVKLVCSDLSSKLNLTGWYNVPTDHISFWDNEVLKTVKRTFRFIMTPHVHHWDSMIIFEETTKSLFTSDLFIQPGDNKPILSEDLSDQMIQLYRAVGIFGSEGPVRQTTKRLVELEPKITFPMHGSCIDATMFSSYTDAIMDSEFAYSGNILGQKVPIIT
jgi:flavorubredoxin